MQLGGAADCDAGLALRAAKLSVLGVSLIRRRAGDHHTDGIAQRGPNLAAVPAAALDELKRLEQGARVEHEATGLFE